MVEPLESFEALSDVLEVTLIMRRADGASRARVLATSGRPPAPIPSSRCVECSGP